jgi:homopolymeric O-antigen transport system permease protein
VLFFISPVLWRPELIPTQYQFLAEYNPVAQFLDLLRKPLLAEPVSAFTWLSTTAIAVGGIVIAAPLIGRFRNRVIFWA